MIYKNTSFLFKIIWVTIISIESLFTFPLLPDVYPSLLFFWKESRFPRCWGPGTGMGSWEGIKSSSGCLLIWNHFSSEIKRSGPGTDKSEATWTDAKYVCVHLLLKANILFSANSLHLVLPWFFFKGKHTHKTACHCRLPRARRQGLECFPVTNSLSWFSHEKETQSNKRCLWKVLWD